MTAAARSPRGGRVDPGLLSAGGAWHFHPCIGEHTASGPELGRIRRCSRAELYRSLGPDGAPVSWGARLFNGRDEQMMTVLPPNPFLTDRQVIADAPDFGRLAASPPGTR
ncbi:hypothetical protein [Streptomyces sp. I6]|uniref:DUF7676 family protein n=1 Tax=Streptomyces sp. I6 TaxID=2483113 RepID=UPI0028800B0D|nr:hypothetical protein [Streptomyces sp. I6]